MLDQEDRQFEPFLDFVDQRHEFRRLARIHPRRRFVQQKQSRLRGERPRDLEFALQPVGQTRRLLVRQSAQTEDLEELERLALNLALLAPEARRAHDRVQQTVIHMLVVGDLHVFEHTQVAQESDILKRPRHAAMRNLIGRTPREVVVVKPHLTARQRFQTRQQVENRRFARPVRPDQADQVVRPHRQAEAVHGAQPAKVLDQVFRPQQGKLALQPLALRPDGGDIGIGDDGEVAHALPSRAGPFPFAGRTRRRNRSPISSIPRMPCGRNRIRTISINAKITCGFSFARSSP